MSEFRRVKAEGAAKPASKENEIRIVASRGQKMYIKYAIDTLNGADGKTKSDSLVLSGMGNAVYNVVDVVENLKRRVAGLHQTTEINAQTITDKYEAVEEGKAGKEVERKVSVIEIVLSKKALDAKHPGYQKPLAASEINEKADDDEEPKRDNKAVITATEKVALLIVVAAQQKLLADQPKEDEEEAARKLESLKAFEAGLTAGTATWGDLKSLTRKPREKKKREKKEGAPKKDMTAVLEGDELEKAAEVIAAQDARIAGLKEKLEIFKTKREEAFQVVVAEAKEADADTKEEKKQKVEDRKAANERQIATKLEKIEKVTEAAKKFAADVKSGTATKGDLQAFTRGGDRQPREKKEGESKPRERRPRRDAKKSEGGDRKPRRDGGRREGGRREGGDRRRDDDRAPARGGRGGGRRDDRDDRAPRGGRGGGRDERPRDGRRDGGDRRRDDRDDRAPRGGDRRRDDRDDRAPQGGRGGGGRGGYSEGRREGGRGEGRSDRGGRRN